MSIGRLIAVFPCAAWPVCGATDVRRRPLILGDINIVKAETLRSLSSTWARERRPQSLTSQFALASEARTAISDDFGAERDNRVISAARGIRPANRQSHFGPSRPRSASPFCFRMPLGRSILIILDVVSVSFTALAVQTQKSRPLPAQCFVCHFIEQINSPPAIRCRFCWPMQCASPPPARSESRQGILQAEDLARVHS